MSARRRGRPWRPWLAAVAVLVLLVLAAHSAALLGLALLAAIGLGAVWIDRRYVRPRAAPGARGPRPASSPAVRAEVIRPGAQVDARSHQFAALKADHARLAERDQFAAAIIADHGAMLADAQTELARERGRLADARGRIADLERQLADAEAARDAAWDAAADRPPSPRPRPVADARAGLLGAPLSGARPLIGGD